MQSFKDWDRDGQHGDDTSSCINRPSLFTDFPKVLKHRINYDLKIWNKENMLHIQITHITNMYTITLLKMYKSTGRCRKLSPFSQNL
jgi:hypothetical protein